MPNPPIRVEDIEVVPLPPSASRRESCAGTLANVDAQLLRRCATHPKTLAPCDEREHRCPCSHDPSGPRLVDLIVLIDGSGSMQAAAQSIGKAAESAIEAAQATCPADLRVTWLSVDDRKPGSAPPQSWLVAAGFNQSHQKYLEGVGFKGPFQSDVADSGYTSEQGADAIADLSVGFDWREGACRAVLYISDTGLEGNSATVPATESATVSAIGLALANRVTVFAHLVEPYTGIATSDLAAVAATYQNLAAQTGGKAVIGGKATVALYRTLLRDAICNACGGCRALAQPTVEPCFSVRWGDGERDQIETDDHEVLCITACNCYSNVTFEDLTIGYVLVVDGDGRPVANLPDGTPSAVVHPLGPICFGDLGPCVDNRETCKSREIVLTTCGAREGKYRLVLGSICFGVSFHYRSSECFTLELVAS